MNLSSPASPGASGGFITEPPLSPGAAPIASTPTPPPAPAPAPKASGGMSIEAQVVRLGLLTPDQVATAMREEAESGRSFDDVVVEHGWISADDLARVRQPEAEVVPITPPPPAPAPPPAPNPEPIAAVTSIAPVQSISPAVEEMRSERSASVFVRLTSGERIPVGEFDSAEAAESRARELMQQLDGDGEWPQIEGRYVRPDAVVSIDVDATV